MAMNITRLSTHSGITYLLETVTNGDAKIGKNGFIDYYTATGTPAGRWLGSGLEGMGIVDNSVVSPSQAQALFHHFKNPLNGKQLGTKPSTDFSVAGFDLTFTIPKSVSVLWALSDRNTQQQIMAAHEQAMADTLKWLEREVIQTRAGKAGIAIHETRGLSATRYHHWDSRDGDPHLHTHVAIANRVQRDLDGKWTTIDSRALYKSAVAASEIHSNYLLDELTRTLGLEFVESQTDSRAVVLDVAGIPSELTDLFSGRSNNIKPLYDMAVEQWTAEHGAPPTGKTLARLKSDIWRATRQPKDKSARTLNEIIAGWKSQANVLGIDLTAMVDSALHRVHDTDVAAHNATSPRLVDATTHVMFEGRAEEIAQGIFGLVAKTKTTWTLANLRAEAERATRDIRCDSPQDRDALVGAVVDHAVSLSVELSARQRYDLSAVLDQDDRFTTHNSSMFDDATARIFTSQRLLDTEEFLLRAATDSGPTIDPDTAHTKLTAASHAQREARGFGFADDQLAAALKVLTDGTTISGIVGPAGTGKTTTMAAIKDVWDNHFGHGKVMGLTTSAQAASVLEHEIDSASHTVTKWLYESVGEGAQRRAEELYALQQGHPTTAFPRSKKAIQRRILKLVAQQERWRIQPGQLIILDEASMTGTHDIAAITTQVQQSGAKLLLVGDPQQLGAIDAGGFLGLLENRHLTTSLSSVWRFTNDWEKALSLQLRDGDPRCIDEYEANGRIESGTTEDMMENAYEATRTDQLAGKTTILIAATNEAVKDLNARFMHDRRVLGEVDADTLVDLRDGYDAGIGEILMARKVDRRLQDSAGDFLKNGTQVTVETITPTHITARRSDTSALVSIPREWVKDHMELGYAITAHRAQGTTVDTGHFVIPEFANMPRELLYVAMTRGRQSNKVWVGEAVADSATQDLKFAYVPETRKDILTRIINTSGAAITATGQREQWDETYFNLSRLREERAYLRTVLNEEIGRQHLDDAHAKIYAAYPHDIAQDIIESPQFVQLAGYLQRNNTTAQDLRDACPTWRFKTTTDPTTSSSPQDREFPVAPSTEQPQETPTTTPICEVSYHLKRVFGDQHVEDSSLANNSTLATYFSENQRLMNERKTIVGKRARHESWFDELHLAVQQDPQLVENIAAYRESYKWGGHHPLGPQPSPYTDTEHYEAWGTLAKRITHTIRATRHTDNHMPTTTPEHTQPSIEL